MADHNMNKNQDSNDRNQTKQHEQAKASDGGENRSQTGEPGRARDEIKQGQGQAMGQSGNSPTAQSGENRTNRETENSGSTSR